MLDTHPAKSDVPQLFTQMPRRGCPQWRAYTKKLRPTAWAAGKRTPAPLWTATRPVDARRPSAPASTGENGLTPTLRSYHPRYCPSTAQSGRA